MMRKPCMKDKCIFLRMSKRRKKTIGQISKKENTKNKKKKLLMFLEINIFLRRKIFSYTLQKNIFKNTKGS